MNIMKGCQIRAKSRVAGEKIVEKIHRLSMQLWRQEPRMILQRESIVSVTR